MYQAEQVNTEEEGGETLNGVGASDYLLKLHPSRCPGGDVTFPDHNLQVPARLVVV